MNKKFLVKFIMLLAVVAVGVLWLISLINPDLFGEFKVSYAIAIICGLWGLSFLLTGLFSKTNTISKKGNIFIATGFFVGAAFAVIASFGLDDKFIAPIIFLVCVGGLVFSLLATGGKNWDAGDNQKVGYKNYYQRKAEEEKEKDK